MTSTAISHSQVSNESVEMLSQFVFPDQRDSPVTKVKRKSFQSADCAISNALFNHGPYEIACAAAYFQYNFVVGVGQKFTQCLKLMHGPVSILEESSTVNFVEKIPLLLRKLH